MVKIRLQRQGKKKAPFYHIVVADSRSPRDGKIIEQIGTYDPMKEPAAIVLNNEKVEKWIKNGAKPTETVRKLIEKVSGMKEKMKEILETIISNLVENKEAAQVTQIEGEKSVVFEVKVAEGDMGKIIGKQGRIAKSIRTVMKAVAAKEHKKASVEFIG